MSCAPARTCYARCVIPWGEAVVTYYAHTLEGHPESEWQRLDDHLRNVAQLAERFAREARPGDEVFGRNAYWAGLLHDPGRYTNGPEKCSSRMGE